MNETVPLAARHLSVTGLACSRGEELILSDIALDAGPGEILLLRGPNGAGKTTLLLCLAGQLRHEGQILWQGRGEEARAGSDLHLIGHLPALKPSLTVEENLRFWSRLNGGDQKRVPAALEACGLGGLGDLDAGVLSAGQTRRLSLARLLVAERPVWLLDEPSSALDAKGEKWIGGLMADHARRGGLVIAATHLDLDLGGHAARTITIGATA